MTARGYCLTPLFSVLFWWHELPLYLNGHIVITVLIDDDIYISEKSRLNAQNNVGEEKGIKV
jgi:hypothetical protein